MCRTARDHKVYTNASRSQVNKGSFFFVCFFPMYAVVFSYDTYNYSNEDYQYNVVKIFLIIFRHSNMLAQESLMVTAGKQVNAI